MAGFLVSGTLPATPMTTADVFVEAIRERAQPLHDPSSLDPILAHTAERRLVLLGEATHGTREFYLWRKHLSRRLVEEQGYRFIAVEGDWKAFARLNRYVRLEGDAASAREVLLSFDRWPLWMWANEEVVALAEWLRQWNAGRPPAERVSIYGKDIYGLWDSLDAVLAYYAAEAPEAKPDVRRRYDALLRHRPDEQAYTRALHSGAPSAREPIEEVVEKLRQRHEATPGPESFAALQNAKAVRAGEAFFRKLTQGDAISWNSRVDYMHATVGRLLDHHGPASRGIVWAHNTHIGDARATSMALERKRNIGQLARESLGPARVFAVGFSTYQGRVAAGHRWGAPVEFMAVPPAIAFSIDAFLHRAFSGDFLVVFDDAARLHPALSSHHGQRAIGVVYNPRFDFGQYVDTRLSHRYDALLFFPETHPVSPLHGIEAYR